jgi:hypothetical protein
MVTSETSRTRSSINSQGELSGPEQQQGELMVWELVPGINPSLPHAPQHSAVQAAPAGTTPMAKRQMLIARAIILPKLFRAKRFISFNRNSQYDNRE